MKEFNSSSILLLIRGYDRLSSLLAIYPPPAIVLVAYIRVDIYVNRY